MITNATIFVVDDDPAICLAIDSLLTSLGYAVETFRSAEDFLENQKFRPGCLLLDVRLPGVSGLQLQKLLKERGDRIPIIFITGYADVSMAVQAIKAGAVDFLQKPFREQDLLDTIQAALRLDRVLRAQDCKLTAYASRYRSLTERDREIMHHVVTGQMNKQIAALIGLSEVTIKVRRAQIMQKMGVSSLVELVRIADNLTHSSAEAVAFR